MNNSKAHKEAFLIPAKTGDGKCLYIFVKRMTVLALTMIVALPPAGAINKAMKCLYTCH